LFSNISQDLFEENSMVNTANRKKRDAILIITDRESNNFCRTLALKNRKVRVGTFGDAKDEVTNCQADMILIDCAEDAEEGLKILRNNKYMCPNIPNIFITNISYKDLALRVFRSGARDFFRKPFNALELRNTIEGLLAVRQMSKEARRPFINTSDPL
jgi:DNA-binding NtrC family response regulator